MSDFMSFVFDYLGRALVLAVPAGVLCVLALVVAAALFKRKGKKFPWGKALAVLALAGYLLVVVFVTMMRPGAGAWRDSNLHLFRAWREAWNNFSEKNWLNVFLNIGMFVPLGVLLPLVAKKLRKWYLMLPAGFLTTLVIETAQFFLDRGLFDVDDLFANTLGAMLGFWTVSLCLAAVERSGKRCLHHGAALLAAAAAMGSIFVVYGLQEYGNLTSAPAFRVDTSEIQWTVSLHHFLF